MRRFPAGNGAFFANGGRRMQATYSYGTVRDSKRTAIYAVRVHDRLLDPAEVDQVAARMREKIEARGELSADVVVVQGDAKETLHLSGTPYSVSRVRAAMFSAAIRWMPVEFD